MDRSLSLRSSHMLSPRFSNNVSLWSPRVVWSHSSVPSAWWGLRHLGGAIICSRMDGGYHGTAAKPGGASEPLRRQGGAPGLRLGGGRLVGSPLRAEAWESVQSAAPQLLPGRAGRHGSWDTGRVCHSEPRLCRPVTLVGGGGRGPPLRLCSNSLLPHP